MRRHIARLLGVAPRHRSRSCGSSPPRRHRPATRATTTSTCRRPAAQAATEIKLMPCAFAPTIANVPVGSKVTFVNGPDFIHLVTGANQAWGSRDAEIQPGGTVSYTFDKAGIYPYACALHRGMSGAIIVGDAVAASGGGAAGAGTTGGEATTTGAAPASDSDVRDGSTRWTRDARARGRRRAHRRGGGRRGRAAAARPGRGAGEPAGRLTRLRSGGRPSRSRGWPSRPRRR